MKRIIPLILVLMLASCYGSYSASHALNRWNGHVTGSRIGNSVIHFVLLPVTVLVFGADIIVFNNIEFITGTRVFN